MSSEWPVVALNDVLSTIIDYRGKTPPKSETGIAVLTAASVKDGRVLKDKVSYISQETYEKVTTRGFPQEGDVLITTEAPVGEVAPFPTDKTYHITRRIMALRGNGDIIDSDFLLYALLGPHNQSQLEACTRGSTVPRVLKTDITGLEFSLPPLPVQQQIGGFLAAIDAKIGLNSRTNQTLEEMAQAIFKSWFVDFDPVKAKMNGEQPEGMDAATASLFPEKLVESELGLIPDGWSVKEAKSQLDVLRGFSYKGKGLVGSLDEGVPMHNLNSVLEGGGYKYAGLKFYSEEFKEKFAIQEGDVLVANTEQGHNHLLIGYGAMVPKHLAHGFFSHHTYRVRPKKNSNMTPEFIERLFGKGRFVRQVQGFTNGTTVNMLPTAGMEMPKFVVPPKALAQKFSELVKPMKAMIEENHKSNIELAKLRDTLLPKLLSGEIELGQTEQMVEAS
ncbi:restriction endonuclease subunit S [Photobacterium sp. J15]|uniref:restriction endonuclease subunit S n=1 Tax=Photobacterium sp. J15 TaxID=265901 RepID=UPI0007E3859C|nr:restriction endonuclease subunit S [Photobacterium sp. J15]